VSNKKEEARIISSSWKRKSRVAMHYTEKIWATPIDLFLHLTTIKIKVYNDAGRLDNSESRGD
jgi:hypothetical protein